MDDVKLRTRLWLQGSLPRGGAGLEAVTGTTSIQIHVDDLLPSLKTWPIESMLEPACRAFAELVEQLGSGLQEFVPRLAIELRSDDAISLNVPNPARIADEIGETPPDLYVSDRKLDSYFWPVERYSIPMIWPELSAKCNSARAIYRSQRRLTPRNDGEWVRMILVQADPAAMLP